MLRSVFISRHSCLIALLTVVLSGCVSDDTDFSAYINAPSGGSDPQTAPVTPHDIDLDFTALDESETIPTTGDIADDYVENSDFTRVLTVTYQSSGAEVSGSVSGVTVSVSGAHVLLRSAVKGVRVILKGASDNGSLKVYSDYKWRLDLQGVALTNPSGAAINNQSGKALYVVVADGTDNTLRDGATYTEVAVEDQRAALFSEGQLIFSGSGRLNVYGTGKSAIASDDYIRVRPHTMIYACSTANHGIRGKDGLFVTGGVINVEVSAAGGKGLNSSAEVVVSGGRTTVITTGGPYVDVATGDTASCAGVKADDRLTVSAGTLRLKSTGEGGKGINGHAAMMVSGGVIEVVTTGEKTRLASPKGIKVDGMTTITGGSLYSYSAGGKPVDFIGGLNLSPGYLTLTDADRIYEVAYP